MPSWEPIVRDPNLWKGLLIGFIGGLVAAKPLWIRFKMLIRRMDDKINCGEFNEVID